MTRPEGANAPYTKPTRLFPRARWTEDEDAILLGHPEMSATELSDSLLPGRSPKAIRRRRERIGRWGSETAPVCRKCDARPVWEESARARRMGLCKGCYLDEMEHREREDRRANALRQSLFKERKRAGRDGNPTIGA